MRRGNHVPLNVQRKFERSYIFPHPAHLSANIPIHLSYLLPMPQYPIVPLPVCHVGMVYGCENYILLSRHEVTCRDKHLFVVHSLVVIIVLEVLVPSDMIENSVTSVHMGGTLKESRTGVISRMLHTSCIGNFDVYAPDRQIVVPPACHQGLPS